MVIGLEVHVELATTTKLFCGCPNHFGDEPNTNICPVCLGLPGSLPVLNRSAVDLAIKLGQALHCTVVPSIFHRKNYFYPDMPKDYQVSQYDQPVNVDGYLDLPSGTRVGIERAHMEEDTGKSTHLGVSGRIQGAGGSLVDYNRAGVPLVEIVSRPDLRSSEDARGVRQRAASDPARHRRERRQDGRGVDARRRERVDASGRHRSVRHTLRDQEPELDPVSRSRHRVRGEAADRPTRRRGADHPADAALERRRGPHAHTALEGRGRRLPLLPRARPRAARTRRRVDRGRPRFASAPPRRPPR